MSAIDQKLNKVYTFIEQFVNDNGYPPSVREICAKLGIKSTASAYSYIDKLEQKGLICKDPSKKRAINLTNRANGAVYAPLIGTITAGKPIFAVEEFENFYPLPPEFKSETDVFLLSVRGNSMIECGIFEKDKIIVRKQPSADDGDIVVAMIEDEATVKRFFKKNGKIVLHPENSSMEDMIFDDVTIIGKVIGLYREF